MGHRTLSSNLLCVQTATVEQSTLGATSSVHDRFTTSFTETLGAMHHMADTWLAAIFHLIAKIDGDNTLGRTAPTVVLLSTATLRLAIPERTCCRDRMYSEPSWLLLLESAECRGGVALVRAPAAPWATHAVRFRRGVETTIQKDSPFS
jgi:hypothetical protein